MISLDYDAQAKYPNPIPQGTLGHEGHTAWRGEGVTGPTAQAGTSQDVSLPIQDIAACFRSGARKSGHARQTARRILPAFLSNRTDRIWQLVRRRSKRPGSVD